MPSVLITGASRGIGLEFARQYAADGWRVHAACRDPDGARDLAGLAGEVSRHRLDVTDPAEVEALARALGDTPIDLLINNAGIYGPRDLPFDGLDYEIWAQVLATNTLAPMRVVAGFVDHVAASDQKKIVTISSNAGSIANNTTGGSYLYRSSKAALNAAMKSLAVDLANRGIVACVLHPGWVRTDMGGPGAPVGMTESIAGMRQVIARLDAGTSGHFFNYDGTELPW